MQSKISSINTEKVFGKPAVSFIGLQVYYDCYKHQDDPIFKKDKKWFQSHPRQRRVIRTAMDAEFDHTEAGLDYFGKRCVPAKLWVSVERRMGGQQHVVQPVYRGRCFWDVDEAGYVLPNDSKDDEGNGTVDILLYRMHLSDGVYLPEMLELAEKVAEVLLASAKQIGAVN
jgi:hypothetical protein